MVIRLDYDKVKALGAEKGIGRLSELCREAKVNYNVILNNRHKKNGISIENAWLLATFLECDIKDIVTAEE